MPVRAPQIPQKLVWDRTRLWGQNVVVTKVHVTVDIGLSLQFYKLFPLPCPRERRPYRLQSLHPQTNLATAITPGGTIKETFCSTRDLVNLKAERPRVRFNMVPLEFFIYIILPTALWCWGRVSPWQKCVPGVFSGGEGDGNIGLTTLPAWCADCLEFYEPKPFGTLWAGNGLIHGVLIYIHGVLMYIHGVLMYIHGVLMYIHGVLMYIHGVLMYIK